MPYRNNITQLCERAAAALLKTDPPLDNFTDAEIFEGITISDLLGKRVVCYCPEATADTQFEGNWLCKLRIEVYSKFDEAKAAAGAEDHHQRAGEVFSKFMTATCPADLSALADFTAQIVVPIKQAWGIEKERRAWVSWLELEVNCCASDL